MMELPRVLMYCHLNHLAHHLQGNQAAQNHLAHHLQDNRDARTISLRLNLKHLRN